jgi:hypothetical protein
MIDLETRVALTLAAADAQDALAPTLMNPAAERIVREHAAGLRLHARALTMTDDEIRAALAEGDAKADVAWAESRRRSWLTAHERIAETAARRRMREARE